jgi:uncharacterized membrane protein YphA (DoxX/SURF4 family)
VTSSSERGWGGPAREDAALLLLRGAGLMLALTFGRQKVVGYIALIRAGQPLASSGLAPLIAALGLPAPGFLGVCAVLNESIGASLIAFGLLTRVAAAVGAVGMAVAFYVSVRLGEDQFRAALYLIIFAALAIAGPGRFSLDHLLWRRGHTGRAHDEDVPRER